MTTQPPTTNNDEIDKFLQDYMLLSYKYANRLTPSKLNLPIDPIIQSSIDRDVEIIKLRFHRYAQKMVLAELRELNQNATGDKCCSTHHTLVDRIITLEKELKHE